MRIYRRIPIVLVCLLVIAFLASCSTGNAGPLIRGKVQHNYGRTIDNSKVTVTVDSTQITPDKRGYFYYRTEPGEHSVTAAYADTSLGINLLYQGHINLGDKELLDLPLYLRDSQTVNGWTYYRQGEYDDAIDEFQHYANVAGNDDAFNGLGWATWLRDRDYGTAMGYLHDAVKEVRNIEARVAMCGIELDRVNTEGGTAFGRAMQDLNLALAEPDGFTTKPRHDDVQEGDILALKALMSYMNGDTQDTMYILQNNSDKLDNETNTQGKDLLKVLNSFMGS
jgi:tetratricopeptide (TPR) repeat protein